MTSVSNAKREASWDERAATLAMFLALGIGVGTWAAALPRLKAVLALSDRDLSFALLAVSGGAVLATILGGMLAPRFGTGRSTGVTAFAAVLSIALPGLAGTLAQLIVCGLAIGLTGGALDVAMNGHASDIERRWSAPIMSSFHAAFSVGGLLGSSLGGVLTATGFSVAGQLDVPVAISLAIVAVATPFLGAGAHHRDVSGSGLAWPERSAFGLCAIVILSFLIEGAVADWSGVYLATDTGASVAEAASAYAAFSLAMTGGRLVGDSVVHLLGPVRVTVAGGLIAALGIALAILVPIPAAAAAGFALTGVGAANVVPVVFSAAGRHGSSPSAGVAMVAGFGYLGFMGGPPLIGAVATVIGLRGALVVLLAAALFVAIGGRWVGAPRRD